MEASVNTLTHIAEPVSLEAVCCSKDAIVRICALGYPIGNKSVENDSEITLANRLFRYNRDIVSLGRGLDELFAEGTIELFVGLLINNRSIVPHISCVFFAIKEDWQTQINAK